MEFIFQLAPRVIFGMSKTQKLGEIMKESDRSKIMIVSDLSMVTLGFVSKITDILDEENLDYVIFDKVMPNPTDTMVQEGTEIAVKHKVDAFVGIGGGSVLDSAKAINVLMTNGGQISDYQGMNMVNTPLLPMVLLPTTSGTASELTSVSIITDSTNHKKMVIAGDNIGADVAICDPNLTMTLPKSVTAATGMDALTHAIEAYISKLASPDTDSLALRAVEVIMDNLEKAVTRSDIESRTQMMLGSVLAGMAFNSALLGLVHSLAHPLSAHFDTPHGIANAIFLPYIMDYNMDAICDKVSPLAKAMGFDIDHMDDDRIQDAIVNRLHQLLDSLNIPPLSSLDTPSDMVAVLAKDAMAELSTLFNPKEASEGILIGIINQALTK